MIQKEPIRNFIFLIFCSLVHIMFFVDGISRTGGIIELLKERVGLMGLEGLVGLELVNVII